MHVDEDVEDNAGKLAATFFGVAADVGFLFGESGCVGMDVTTETGSPVFSGLVRGQGSGVRETTGCNDLRDGKDVLDESTSDSWLAAFRKSDNRLQERLCAANELRLVNRRLQDAHIFSQLLFIWSCK